MELGINFYSKMVPQGLPGRSQSLPRQPQEAQRRLQAASVTPVWFPQAPLESLWLPLGTA